MLKLNCGFSRKVGEANYGSRGASVNLELELPTDMVQQPDALNDRVRRLFVLAKQAVDDELNGQPAARPAAGAGNGHASGAAPAGNGAAQAGGNGAPGNSQPGSSQPGNGSAATNKQVKLILDLGRTRKMSLSAVEQFCREMTGSAGDVYGLTKSQASAVIDRFKAEQASPEARR